MDRSGGIHSPGRFESLLSGSFVTFKKLVRPQLTQQEQKLYTENKRRLQEGIEFLRVLRTQALDEQDLQARQGILQKAHHFSVIMAEEILNQAISDNPFGLDQNFLEILKNSRNSRRGLDAGSGHGLPPNFSLQNLLNAADDMLVRIQEKARSFRQPDHRLTQDEMKYVIHEFLRGTNDLTINAIEKFFDRETKVGGILSGGSVYLEMVKKIVERYGDPSLTVNTFVIAVDKHTKRTVVEIHKSDSAVRTVIITDDLIDKGGTMLTALWSTGENFPNAIIYSGKGTDQPGGFEKRRVESHMGYLGILFQDFYDLSEESRTSEALNIFRQAEQYAEANKVTLQPGWIKIKERIEKRKVK